MSTLSVIPLSDIEGATDVQDEYIKFALLDYGKIQAELENYGVTLAEDPTTEGIQKLNGLIAQIDAQKTRVSNIVSTAINNDNNLEVLYKKIQGIYKREFDSRLPHPPVSEFSNMQSREAACNSILKDLKTLVNAIEGSYSQAKMFTKMAYTALSKLDSTNKNISRQITVLQLATEIGEIARPSHINSQGSNFSF